MYYKSLIRNDEKVIRRIYDRNIKGNKDQKDHIEDLY